MTFDSVRQYGVSLFASAGAAGLILGLAARPVLSNLLAGIQIAMTQPIRVEDQVVVEGETGWIETITSTYVVVRLWDLRRMVVPLSYFIEKPFQNWTYEAAAQIGAVLLRVGYTVSVDSLRQKFDEIVRQSPLWDRRVAKLEVTDVAVDAVELRALISARNPGQTWDLRCEVREKLFAFVQAQQLRRSESTDSPPSRDLATGDDRAVAPTKPRPDQRTSSPAASDSAMR
jgi:small-conductance mechanosensitive channel